MSNNAIIIDLSEMFQKVYGSNPYKISEVSNGKDSTQSDYKGIQAITKNMPEFTPKGSLLREQYLGIEIFLPIRLFDESGKELMYLPYCVLSISCQNEMIRTSLIDRLGSVKEQFNTDDYKISIKGFLIGSDRKFPEEQIKLLRDVFESKQALRIDNAITNIFLSHPDLSPDEQYRVVVTAFNMPEVQGGREHVRPFTLSLESDTIFDLELE